MSKKLLKKNKMFPKNRNRILKASLEDKKWFLELVNDCREEDSWKKREKKKIYDIDILLFVKKQKFMCYIIIVLSRKR